MGNKRSPHSLIGILVALCAASLLCATGAMSQTLTNGNFEGGGGGTVPGGSTATSVVANGWTGYLQSTGAFSLQTANSPQGTYYQQVQVLTASNYGGVYQRVTGFTPCATYTISGQYRTNSASATSTVLVDLAGGTSRAAAVPLCSGTTSSAWVPFSGTVTATGTAITIFLDLAITTVSKAGAFDAVTITLCTPPAPPTSPSANPSTGCGGVSSTLSASVAGGCTVDWFTGSCCGGTLVGFGTSIVANPATTTTYYPRARNISTGCTSTACGTPVTITVSSTPSAPTNVAANPSSITSGQSSTLSATVGGGETVDWYTGSCGGTLVVSGSTLVVTPGSTTAYYPRARNTTSGCASVSCGATVTVTVGIPPQPIHYVKPHVGGTHNGLTWATAFDTIQEAVDIAASSDEVWVASGTYTENILLKSAVALYGGFAGTETARSQRNWTTNVTILDGNGGGPVVEVVKNATSATRIDGFTIRNGHAVTGGGVYCNQGASPVIVNNIITGNSAAYDGGGVYCNLGSAAVIAGNKIMSNGAITAGGGVRSTTGAAVITDNIIAANSAQVGAGVACGDTSTASHEYVVNNTFVSNAAISGGGIYCFDLSSASISNNIVFYNSSGIGKASGGGAPSLKKNDVYSNIAYNYSGISAGSTDISSDPVLASAGYGNLHIQPTSPCRNTGNNTEVISGYLDVDNQTRIQNTTVDIGADESDGTTWTITPAIVRVKTDGSDSNNGSSWALAKRNIQSAIDAAAPSTSSGCGGEVWVKAGTYNERLTLRDYACIYGGFAGAETARTQRNWTSNVTIVDAGQTGAVATAALMGYRVSGIDGFTLRNGKSLNGAGVGCYMASPLVMNNTITSNSASRNGGGVYLGSSMALVKANSIIDNYALGSGGGVYSIDSKAEVYRNNIEHNTSCSNGSGVFTSTNDICKLTNNRIVKNHGDTAIGGTWGSAVSGDSYGGAVLNCNTIADNTSATGAIYCGVYGNMAMYSNILALNSAGLVKDTNATVTQVATYTSDPLFVNRTGGNYSLQSGSGCIDAADAGTAPSEDYTGAARPVDGDGNGSAIADIGCYEYGASQEYPVAPTSASATPSTICSGGSSTLHATGGSGTTLRWLTGSCDGTSVGTGNDLVVNPTSTTTYYARWETIMGNSTCVTATVTVSGTGPTATVGGPQSIPWGGTTTGLGGNTPTPPATGAWSVVSGGTGTFSSTTDPNAMFAHTGGDGPITLRWTVSSPPCPPATADVTVTIATYCLNNGNFDGGFTGDIGTGWTKQTPESGTWAMETTIKHSGAASQKITDPSGAPSYTTWLYETVSVKPGKVYVPTMWIYRVNSAVAHIGVDPDGGTTFIASDGAPTSNQWTYRVHDPFTAGSAGVATIGIAAGYQTNSGTIYFDDVGVEPQAPQSSGGTATISSGNSATITASGGFGGASTELCWYTGPAGTGTHAGAGTSLVVSPTSTTTYYPRWETSGDCGISADGAPVTITVTAPVAPTLTSITPSSGANTGTTSITDLAGTGFQTGATVKLKRTGQTDITATGVSVVNSTKITCSLDLTDKKTGLWDVFVQNTDLLSGTLANGFGITVSDSLPIVGMTNRSVLDSIMTTASLNRRITVWGKVALIDSSTFWLDDGSGTSIKAFAPGYADLVNGNYASATGGVDLSVSPPVLVSNSDRVRKYN